MKREDIIRMAREAGMEQDGDNFFSPSHEEIDVHITDLERFAALVAATEREAMVAEAAKLGWAMKNEDPFEDAVQEVAAIRARSNT